MVEVIEDWNALIEHIRYCRTVIYKVDLLPDGVRLRVRAGMFGYDKVLSKKEADEKISYLEKIGAVKIIESIPDSIFFI